MALAPQLKNILSLNLAPGASVVLPHGLDNGTRPLSPDIIFLPSPDLEVTLSNETSVTIRNNGAAAIAEDVLVEAWHTIERAFGDVANADLPVKPYIVYGGDSSFPVNADVVFRPGDPAGNHGSVFATWADAYAAVRSVVAQGSAMGGGKCRLWFDSTYASVLIPAGTWNMTGVTWRDAPHAGILFVDIADGAAFVLDPTTDTMWNALSIIGYGLGFRYDGVGPIAPFTNITVRCGGSNVRFVNNNALAKPMFVLTEEEAQLEFSGECARGGFGYGGADLAAPIYDVRGGFLQLLTGACIIGNNAFTDTTNSGTAVIDFRTSDDAFIGNNREEFLFASFEAAGGTLIRTDDSRVRWSTQADMDQTGANGTVVPADSPYPAYYNQLVRADTTLDDIVITAPSAFRSGGERLTVKNFVGANTVTVVPRVGETVESGADPIVGSTDPDVGGGCKTWASDGFGTWLLIADFTPPGP
jgi:hypothetical protein